jgi:hypothetical protein
MIVNWNDTNSFKKLEKTSTVEMIHKIVIVSWYLHLKHFLLHIEILIKAKYIQCFFTLTLYLKVCIWIWTILARQPKTLFKEILFNCALLIHMGFTSSLFVTLPFLKYFQQNLDEIFLRSDVIFPHHMLLQI